MRNRRKIRTRRIGGTDDFRQWRSYHKDGSTAQVHVLGRRDAARAAGQLRHGDPLASAVLGITGKQNVVITGAVIFFGASAVLAPVSAAMVLHHFLWGFFAASITFRAAMLFFKEKPSGPAALPLQQDLPVYTLLIPLYHETQVLGALYQAIGALNYPKSKLDIKLLLEAGDKETISAVSALKPGPEWEILIIPPVGPQTKPKALNAGLARARGSLVTIYDAEDRPHPDQLLHAARAFARDTEGTLGCVQAPLGYYNAGQNWLTRQFALEYGVHFHVLVPAMARLGLPFPLGGTSNHFRALALQDVGAWDPYNVTEDADLGFRLSAHGWRLGTITPPTQEEAVSGLLPWRRQRSRWLKGYIQTLGVHVRRPARHKAMAGALSMTITLGTAVFAALGHASFFVIMLGVLLLSPWFGNVLAPVDYGLALAGALVGMTMLGVGARRAGMAFCVWDIPAAILYWPLQSWAMAKALYDLVKRPFHWEKTTHGLCPKHLDTCD